MNYIYDILVNFNDKDVYEFFEWDKSDNIEHLRRIPFFKVNSKTINDFKHNIVKIEKTFLQKIKNKTEVFSSKFMSYIEYCAIFTDGLDLVVIEFSSDGKSILKSGMLLDESEDALSESELLDLTKIKYEIVKSCVKDELMTRNQKYIMNYIKEELSLLLKSKNYKKLKYLYYEWYNKKSEDITLIIKELTGILKLDFSKKHNNLFEVIKLSNMKEQP